MMAIRNVFFCFALLGMVLPAAADNKRENGTGGTQLSPSKSEKATGTSKKNVEARELKKQLAELRATLAKLGAATPVNGAGTDKAEFQTVVPEELKKLKDSLNQYEVEAAELYTKIHLLTTKLIVSSAAAQPAKQSSSSETAENDGAAGGKSAEPFGTTALFPHPTRPSSGVQDLDAVDRVKLADMLFRNGDYETALQHYRSAAKLELEQSDRDWVNFQIASCLRNLGKLSEAAAIYRELIASTQSKELAKAAGWFLDVIRWRSEMKQALENLEARRKHVAEAIENGNMSQ